MNNRVIKYKTLCKEIYELEIAMNKSNGNTLAELEKIHVRKLKSRATAAKHLIELDFKLLKEDNFEDLGCETWDEFQTELTIITEI